VQLVDEEDDPAGRVGDFLQHRLEPLLELAAVLRSGHERAKIAVDDAGSGYASLRHILALRPAFVKLDLSWVRGIDVDEARQALVRGVCDFATRIGCQIIAEGVETEAEQRTLMEIGVELGQGYLLGRPHPVEASTDG
jgi:EAL domain-containing protein (putative c-di-GMP-specific phosphodiesterase class I)